MQEPTERPLDMQLHPATPISLKSSSVFTEAWLQDVIRADPSLLGLGDLDVRDVERRQPGGGRIDLLLTDPDGETRYEVEIQLGPTDETHIIRTIEYWDLERRRYPQYEHVAVLVAEDVTSRFLNVVNLFNGFIPIIAIQLQAFRVEGALTLVPTRVIDMLSLATEEEDEGTVVDRAYWEKGQGRRSTLSLQIFDSLMELIRTVEPDIQPNFNKHYIGLKTNHGPRNFIKCTPRRKHLGVGFRLPYSGGLQTELEDSGLDVLRHDTRDKLWIMRLNQEDVTVHRETLLGLIRQARAEYLS